MSCTELYRFTNKGWPENIGEVKNAFRGAMSVWHILEEKYLPPYNPEWAKSLPASVKHEHYSRLSVRDKEEDLQEIWDMYKNENMSENDRIVLLSTFDNAVVYRKDIPRLLAAFRHFEGETSLMEQALIIEGALEAKDTYAIAWNQTSVGDPWCYCAGKHGDKAYNLFRGKNHLDVFFENLKSPSKK